MENNKNFVDVFHQLKGILNKYESKLKIVHNTEEQYYLDTKHIDKRNKKPVFFGAAIIKKNYVSYHLFPVYVCPNLLDEISDELKQRMQGNACFNFKMVNKDLIKQLAELTDKGFKKFQEQKFIE